MAALPLRAGSSVPTVRTSTSRNGQRRWASAPSRRVWSCWRSPARDPSGTSG